MAQQRPRAGGNRSGGDGRSGGSGRSGGGDRGGGSRSGGGRPAVATRPAQASRAELAAARHRLQDIVAPVVSGNGYDLETLTVSAVGRRHVVRVVVDSDRGVSLEAVADLSRKISAVLDEVDETDGFDLLAREYQLEVGSPGVDRPLSQPRHWHRNVGRLVKVPVGERTVLARITATDSAGVTLDVAGVLETVPYGDLGAGRVQVEFARLDELADDDLEEIHDEEDQE